MDARVTANALRVIQMERGSRTPKGWDTERVKFDGKKETTCTAVWSLAEIVLQTRKAAIRVKL